MSFVSIERYEHAARVTLNRPDKRNAMSSGVAAELTAALLSLSDDEDLRVVVLSGEGPSFCAGADVTELAALTPETAESFIRGLHAAIAAAMACPVPVIAAIRGACVGAGLELVAGCDLRIATHDARFSMPEVKVGIPSVIEAALLPRMIGRGKASRLVLTGETIDAKTAYEWGLVEELVSDDDLMFRAGALAAEIAEADPAAIRAQKRLIRAWDDLTIDQAVEASVREFADSYRTDAPRARLAAALAARK
ncbi:MAG: enoyl-CoA hydratase-related protein [Thalassobaculaceae bacterium]|nr:enoyl-CoA hydratase-related protein [Thalassobaculaceae bacterium]